jgi:phosphomannomutase
MRKIRTAPPQTLLDQTVSTVDDLTPDADVVRIVAGGARVVLRPSGTEPKLKAYLQVVVPVQSAVADARESAAQQLESLRAEVSALLH